MKIFTSAEIREIEAATIRLEPVTPAGLMERAATALFQQVKDIVAPERKINVFAGPGNNGGDGLVLARLLHEDGYVVRVFVIETGSARSSELNLNAERLERSGIIPVTITDPGQVPAIWRDEVIIDAIFGTGLRKSPSGVAAGVIQRINETGAFVISVDVPSGLFCEDNQDSDRDSIVRASKTLTFQFPKLSFMFAGNGIYTGEWEVIDIGLHTDTISSMATPCHYVLRETVRPMIRKRNKFDHKGTYGHALLIAGSYGKAGAATLSAGAALRSGAGLVTVHTPSSAVLALQAALPEAMVSPDSGTGNVTALPDLKPYNAIGVGPGLGTDPDTASVLRELLKNISVPLILDADALNIIAQNREWLDLLPPLTVLTPHPGEFRRLTGTTSTDFRLVQEQREFAVRYRCVVVLKGAHTSVALPDGTLFFNSTGNPGMATGGSGDVLTGIITSLLAQGYDPSDAAVAGVYLHGLSGDIALRIHSEEAVIAGDILMNIGRAFRETNFSNFNVYL
ncbi:MAG TPA: NAD(P)H-hydrate dehydratase [Bacteroidales bacterium]|jgi:NAD(P)H-hydrate epimerase|nr:NAD(P)H-hydrate dehydratase [Bacteroidales bacterium]MDI9533571.1 NAD(P)H-hydrate dehydratase [Bacteroidota bacterium]MBK7731428.1 NAD(P)H-hydrate dehydratase [Bacteroidales bacterium]MBP7035252.1 NAD(P)H-hydrate dehydratase [Bacteroidales bacterium]MBP8708576.1 NAD(P)H-hydrate dehydratase [Bacteroidales bacterium]